MSAIRRPARRFILAAEEKQCAPGEGQELEQRIRTFSDNEQEREDVEKLLCRIGKSASSYYIPAYMETVEEYKIGFQWLFRGLQILLAACAVLALVLTDSGSDLPCLAWRR